MSVAGLSFFVRFARLAARHPAPWIGLTAACLLALTLLAALALWFAADSLLPPPRALPQHTLKAAPEEGGSRLAPDAPAPLPPEHVARLPGLAVVMDDLGEDMQAVQALLSLRIPIAFAVWPHARHAREAAQAAHEVGCAVLIHQPMEPLDAAVKPGPNALRVGMSRERMEAVFRQSLAAVPHAEGLNNHMGSRFTARREDVRLFCELAANSGLFVLDSMTHPASVLYEEARAAGIPAARNDVFLDAKPGKAAALARLREASRLAMRGRQVIVIGHPRADTLAALREWNSSRDSGLRLLSLRDCLTLP